MTSLHDVLAKSPARPGEPGESLTEHLTKTLEAASLLRQRVGRLAALPDDIRELFWDAVALAAFLHDAGKVADGFQRMVTGQARGWGERHEVVSLGFLPALVPDPGLRAWAAVGVATHHRPLTSPDGRSLEFLYGSAALAELRDRLGPVDPGLAGRLLEWLATTATAAGLAVQPPDGPVDVLAEAHALLGELLDTWTYKVTPDRGLAAVLVQGAVTLADHLSSAHGAFHTRQPLDAGFRPRLEKAWAETGRQPRPHQRRAAETDGHLIVRAPTGSGKTEAGLLWAARQVEAITAATGGAPRVFYTLPYLASINAMALRLGKLLGDEDAIGVAHSRAASYYLGVAITAEDDEETRVEAARKAVARAKATRLFRETVRVGTPYQLLRGALAGPKHSGILIDAANSVFLLDELHAYDPKRLGFILAATRFWKDLGGRIGVLSATLPQALLHLIEEALGETVHRVDGHGQGLPARHRLRLRDRHLTDPASVAEIHQHLAAGRSVLVVANNVADAQHLYDQLAPLALQAHGPEAALLLHSRFRRRDRSRIEEKIHDRFGTRPGDPAGRRPGLLVATQVVEVSLDVDFDVLHTSAAPLEALLQRFGRVNRIAARPPADVVVHAPTYAPRRRGGAEEYADGVYPREPVEAGWAILTRHDGAVVDEDQANHWLDEIYAGPWGERWCADVRDYRERFTEDFLTFTHPFHDRDQLTESFDQLFDGTEAVLRTDLEDYTAALDQAPDTAAGRLLAEDYLIPLPSWAPTRYDKKLGVRVVDADYDEERGLLAIHGGPAEPAYVPGEVI
ncbi:CRISPR-associated helicase/endonuclease Cas3 [Carbonactinospora thermoautotrophica]|uniref:CRISPR-associated helicase Cas3' n=1 Tax=Carbonactinospora thermoautotrophica TaxID=1469144 RepID=UPI00227218B8|nr:CRISPR-associated helicase Cas3' [Carbonactinospora thermoautotrophica]MCX9193106.1 CRISPR-associated helicase/endonuclease Cas3 [Carbonactinospora thermoautotrophica]